ncbi:ribonucleotide reductase inhibitor-domain-containing protein [Nemania serpens]|nr:ribonucleotide reductase inhibitor-domain-containing protein [Nemania serpens]
MSAPRTKRQFAGAASDPAQRHITSFFTTSAPNHNNYSISSQTSSPSLSTAQGRDSPHHQPHIPASVQANLLSVGMRVRKSVPEGYKTGDYNAFVLWDDSDANPAAAAAAAAAGALGEGQRSRANAFSSPRELLPFCGIHKVGGLDTQPDVVQRPTTQSMPGNAHSGGASTTMTMTRPIVYHPSFGADASDDDDDDDDEMPGLTSSQESVESSASGPPIPPATTTTTMPGARARKRYFVEDEDEGGFAGQQFAPWRYHPNTLAPVAGRSNENGRAMAVPSRGRLRAKFSGRTATAVPGAGQENRMVVDGDFGEAEFLDQGVWEVDMDDV